MTTPTDKAAALEELAASLRVSDFDLMLVGDGSGTTKDCACGWFVTSYERASGQVWYHHGGTNGGTNNFAELEPFNYALWSYRHALWHYHGKDPSSFKGIKVLIISDSEVTVRCGNGEYSRRANAPLWASIEWFERHSYSLTWKHVPRNSNQFNKLADLVAGATRKSIITTEMELFND